MAKARRAAPPPAPRPDDGKDYLVIYEESAEDVLPADDTLVLDIEQQTRQRGEMDVQQKVNIGLTNTASRLGTFGFGTSVLGAVFAAFVLVYFLVTFPDDWYVGGKLDVTVIRTFALFSVIGLVLLTAGTILTHYGRRIKAHGELKDVRIVEKEPTAQAHFE